MSNRGYPVELRERVVAACDQGMTQDEAAEFFSVGPATVYRWLRLRRETGELEPKPHGGGYPAALDEAGLRTLAAIVEEKPDRTIAELTAEAVKRVGRVFSDSAVFRALQHLGLTRKKKPSPRSRRTDPTSRSATRSSSKRSRRSTRGSSSSRTSRGRTSQ